MVGTLLDFRLGYGVFGGKDGATAARVVHVADSEGQVRWHADLAGSAYGDLTLALEGMQTAVEQQLRKPDWSAWVGQLQTEVASAVERDNTLLRAEADPIHPGPDLRRAVPLARRRRGRDRRRRRLRVLRREVHRAASGPAAGSTRARTAASVPASVPRSAPGSPAPPRRWCCSSATARRACR